MKVVAVLEAKGSRDLASNYNTDEVCELIEFIAPLSPNGDVPSGHYEKLRCHLTPADGEPGFIREMKDALADDCKVPEILHLVSTLQT